MNAPLVKPATTRAADGFDRYAFTVADVLRMVELGVIDEDERMELIEGEIVRMQAKYFPHEQIKLALIRAFARALPDTLSLGVETTLFLSDMTFVDPDLTIFPVMNTQETRGPDVLLAIEVADSSLGKDLRLKAPLYAKYGVRELWVIDVKTRRTHVFRDPREGVWSVTMVIEAHDMLTHPTAPGFALALAQI